MKISHGLEYAAFWLLTHLVQLIPARLADIVAVRLGKLSHLVLPSRRRIAVANLRAAFREEKNEREIANIAKEVFVNIARASIDFARQPVLRRREILDMVYRETGFEYVGEVLKEGHGLVFLTGHFGSWELLGAWICAKGAPTDFLVGQQHNPYVDRLFNDFRRALGVGIIPVGVAARHVIRSLRANRIVAFLGDQHSASGGAIVDFFGRPASTAKGAAAFATKVGCPIILGLLIRERFDRHRAIIMPPIYPPDSGDKDQDIIWMTQQHTSQLESMIRKYPELWMWTHRRWKVR